MPCFDKCVHVYGWNLSILWSPLNIWKPKNFTIANCGHPASKSWLRPYPALLSMTFLVAYDSTALLYIMEHLQPIYTISSGTFSYWDCKGDYDPHVGSCCFLFFLGLVQIFIRQVITINLNIMASRLENDVGLWSVDLLIFFMITFFSCLKRYIFHLINFVNVTKNVMWWQVIPNNNKYLAKTLQLKLKFFRYITNMLIPYAQSFPVKTYPHMTWKLK